MYEAIESVYVEKFKCKFLQLAAQLTKFNRDIWAVLMAKAEGEAWEKISGAP